MREAITTAAEKILKQTDKMKIKEWFDGEGEEKKEQKRCLLTNLKDGAQRSRKRNLRDNVEMRKQVVEGRKEGKRINV
jgi:hypothetical protein